MKKILDAISEEMRKAFAEAGYDEELGKVSLSNRPDLCEYPVSYTHLDVYKRQPLLRALPPPTAVSSERWPMWKEEATA